MNRHLSEIEIMRFTDLLYSPKTASRTPIPTHLQSCDHCIGEIWELFKDREHFFPSTKKENESLLKVGIKILDQAFQVVAGAPLDFTLVPRTRSASPEQGLNKAEWVVTHPDFANKLCLIRLILKQENLFMEGSVFPTEAQEERFFLIADKEIYAVDSPSAGRKKAEFSFELPRAFQELSLSYREPQNTIMTLYKSP